MAAGPPGQWASVIFVAAQVHTRVRFLFLSFSISLTIRLISHYISKFFFSLTFVILIFFFSLLQKKYILYYFSTQNFL